MAFKILYLRVIPVYSSMNTYMLYSLQHTCRIDLAISVAVRVVLQPGTICKCIRNREGLQCRCCTVGERCYPNICYKYVQYSEHCAHSPHKAATSSILQHANTDAFELKKTAVFTGEAIRQNPSLQRNYSYSLLFDIVVVQLELYKQILQGKTKWS